MACPVSYDVLLRVPRNRALMVGWETPTFSAICCWVIECLAMRSLMSCCVCMAGSLYVDK